MDNTVGRSHMVGRNVPCFLFVCFCYVGSCLFRNSLSLSTLPSQLITMGKLAGCDCSPEKTASHNLCFCFFINMADEFLGHYTLKSANQTPLRNMLPKETNNASNMIGLFKEYSVYQMCINI